MIDLKALRIFLSVADASSMTAAAKRLDVSQSAVSQAIRQLEDHLGVVLIDRDRRPLALTAAGAALREHGRTLVSDAETLYKAIREQATSEAQLLRLGMVDSFAATIGPALLKTLLPSTVHLHVASGLSPGLGEALVMRRLDMIVTTDPPESVSAVLERHRVLSEAFVLLLPRALATLATTAPEVAAPAAAATGTPDVANTLAAPTGTPNLATLAAAAPLLRFNVDSHIGAAIERWLAERGCVAPNRMEIDTADTLVAMVAEGIGWAIVTPLCLLQARATIADSVVCRLPGPTLSRELILVARKGEYGTLPARIAASAIEIFERDWRRVLARIAPWLMEAVTLGQSATNGRGAAAA